MEFKCGLFPYSPGRTQTNLGRKRYEIRGGTELLHQTS